MGKNAKLLISAGTLILGLISIGIYSYMQSREYINGPTVTIRSPKTGETFSGPFIQVDGNAQNVSHISLNDMSIFVDSKGDFSQKLLLLPGYNILTVKAEDRFGKKVQKSLELIYKEPEKDILATSTLQKNSL